MRIPFLALLLQGIPEQIALVTLAFIIAEIPLKWNRIISIGVSQALCAYIIRLFPIPFGIHTIFLLFFLFLVLAKLNNGDVGLAFMASSLSFLLLVILEFSCISFFIFISGFTPQVLFNNLFMRIVVGDLHVVLLLTIAFLLNRLYITKDCPDF